MAKRLYVGNLPYSFTSQDLQKLFSEYGPVKSAEVVQERDTGRSRGFGFVEMETAQATEDAIRNVHDKQVGGRSLVVNEARARTGGGGGGGGRGGASGYRPRHRMGEF
jgi:RNA recognition motif-containing protein